MTNFLCVFHLRLLSEVYVSGQAWVAQQFVRFLFIGS